ncbi:tectonic-2 [Brachionichthys hirsutus]|uniref:tectonic-2 n=1 Tax=Brachionichthys hirsutus TaxID=412623 RepID=UPI003605099E
MANVLVLLLPPSVLRKIICFLLFMSLADTQNTVVFQPSYVTANGPAVSALLLGNTSEMSLNLRIVSPSNTTGSIDSPSCEDEATHWTLTREQIDETAVRVHLRLDKSLRLCGDNDSDTDCCPKPLCVLETIRVSACVDGTQRASLLIQAKIHALLFPENMGNGNETAFPNNTYQSLGSCPCDLTFRACDVRCCCDKDCSNEDLKLFASNCLLGPFGGQVSLAPDYQCSVQSAENAPDWFPFLCVNSPPENNPFLGLFYRGDTIMPASGPSFQSSVLSAPVPISIYTQGSPIFRMDDQYFTIPQKVLGSCVNGAPVAFLKNFRVGCVTLLRSCPTESPLKTLPSDLSVTVKNVQGGDAVVSVTDEVVVDLSHFISNAVMFLSKDVRLVCENVTLALDYTFYWTGSGITNITLRRTVGTVTLNNTVELTTRYSAVFLNGDFMRETNSGNPGYQDGRPVIGGNMDTPDNDGGSIQRTSINLWKPEGDGSCSSAAKNTVLFGYNSTSGCLLPVSRHNVTQCNLLREAVTFLQAALIPATYVAKSGNPDALTTADWVNISFVTLNSSAAMEDTESSCSGIPSHQHIRVWSLATGAVDGSPQREIVALQVSYVLSSWSLVCGGGDVSPCLDPMESQLFPVTSSVTFTDNPVNTGPPKTRFQINFTEYDCDRNDVCWPELAFPITKYYTGEPYSQSLAKGLILVFFFIAASLLGTPWKQIRQAWSCAAL